VSRTSAALTARPGLFQTAATFAELAKPRITFMVLITTATGVWLAPGEHPVGRVLATLLGVALVVAGANALNMYLERDVDALMPRTRGRPLPSGRLQPYEAAWFGLAASALAIPILAVWVNALTALGALSALLVYVVAYTPLKRSSPLSLLVGAVPGAMPPLMGWTAVTGRLDAGGLALFGVLFVWQLPHSIAISLHREAEYRAAGLKVVAVVRGAAAAKEQIAIYSILMMIVSLQVVRTGIGGAFYLASALALGGGMVTLALYGLSRGLQGEMGRRWARWYFFYTLVYLPALFGALAVSRLSGRPW
jgi:protoheme IX farnesyltransferase